MSGARAALRFGISHHIFKHVTVTWVYVAPAGRCSPRWPGDVRSRSTTADVLHDIALLWLLKCSDRWFLASLSLFCHDSTSTYAWFQRSSLSKNPKLPWWYRPHCWSHTRRGRFPHRCQYPLVELVRGPYHKQAQRQFLHLYQGCSIVLMRGDWLRIVNPEDATRLDALRTWSIVLH